jgi:hypothetical protein
MGNSYKEGKIDYFPLDTGFFEDTKVKLLKPEFGNDASITYLLLLCKIYGDKGYYLEWNEDLAFMIAGELGFTKDKVQAIVSRLVKRSMFDEQLFNTLNVLSSKRIQHNYVMACSARTKIRIKKEYLLLNDEVLQSLPQEKVLSKLVFFQENSEEKAINFAVNPIKCEVNKQSTVDNKVNYSRGYDSISYNSKLEYIKAENPNAGENPGVPADKAEAETGIKNQSGSESQGGEKNETSSSNESKYETENNIGADEQLFDNNAIVETLSFKGKTVFGIPYIIQKNLMIKYRNVNFFTEIYKMQDHIDENFKVWNFKTVAKVFDFIDIWFKRAQEYGGTKRKDNEKYYERYVQRHGGSEKSGESENENRN